MIAIIILFCYNDVSMLFFFKTRQFQDKTIKLLSLSFVSKLIILLLKLYIKLIEAFNSMFINWEVVNNSSNELVCVSKLIDANLVGIFICISIGIPNELISSYVGYLLSN